VWATIVGMAAYTLGRGIHRIQGPLGVISATVVICVLGGIFVYLRRNEAKLRAEAEAALPGTLAGYRPRALCVV
jgi:hypothetical protein